MRDPSELTPAELRPALAAAIPFNPVVDVWKSDDWFHWGAFRPVYSFDIIYAMETRPGGFSAEGGAATKLRMLDIEKARLGTERGLFDDPGSP